MAINHVAERRHTPLKSRLISPAGYRRHGLNAHRAINSGGTIAASADGNC